jgi:trimeric autotransporter adhesin
VTAGDGGVLVPAAVETYGPAAVSVVRRIDLRTGRVQIMAGTASGGMTAPGAVATDTALGAVCGVAVDHFGNVLVADGATATHGQKFGYNRILVVDVAGGASYGRFMASGRTYTIAGQLHAGFAGDGGPASRALLDQPSGLGTDEHGNVVVADSRSNRIRVVAEATGQFFGQEMQSGDIYTVAGSDQAGFSGDGVPALHAALDIADLGGGSETRTPLQVDRDGNILFGDTYHGDGRVRLVAAANGEFYGMRMRAGYIYTIAGGGGRYLGYDQLGHGHRSIGSGLSAVTGLALDPAGNLIVSTLYQVWLAAERSGRYYGQDMHAGHLYHLAGAPVDVHTQFPVRGSGGDGAPALRAQFSGILGVTVDADSDVVVVDQTRIRVIAATTGTRYGQQMTRGDIYTIAGVLAR